MKGLYGQKHAGEYPTCIFLDGIQDVIPFACRLPEVVEQLLCCDRHAWSVFDFCDISLVELELAMIIYGRRIIEPYLRKTDLPGNKVFPIE